MAVRITLLTALLAGAATAAGTGSRSAAPFALCCTAFSGGLLLAFLWYTGVHIFEPCWFGCGALILMPIPWHGAQM